MYVRRGLGDSAGTIAATIQKVEGYYPGTLAYKNNNPGNLIYVGQPGATPGAGGFAQFPSYDAGYQALLNQIQNYANRGLTIQQMMDIYAPASQPGNNPTLYANQIASALGVTTDTTVADALAGTASSASDSSALDASLFGTDSGSAFDFSSLVPAGVDPVMVGGIVGLGLLAYLISR